MENKNIVFALSLLFAGAFSSNFIEKKNYQAVNAEAIQETSQSIADDSCTFMYVGKDVSEDGLPIIARTGDGSNPLIYHNVQLYQRNSFANQTYEGKNGFKWLMPEHTYRYIGFPRSQSVGVSLHWDVSTMNECGVAISATLSCYSDVSRILAYDPFIPTGISEDNIAGLLAAVSSSAREAMEYLANVIDHEGSAEANAIMAIDQDEVWYMEIYSGHQYCAVKFPNDKATTIGNEFLLNTLVDFQDEDIIASPNLFNLPKEKSFAVFDGGTDNRHMHLFNTYARPLSYSDEETRMTTDASHMRTWRGINLFAKDEEQVDYQTDVKYPAFFTPKRKLNNNDVFSFYRDRFEDILENPDSKYDIFRNNNSANRLRVVGIETSYQVHVIKVHPNLPKSMAIEAWVAMGNATGAPFVTFNNAMTKFPEEYTHAVATYGPDEESALYICRRISAIANTHPKEYSLPIQKFWNIYENIWSEEYNLCLEKALAYVENNNTSSAEKLLSNMALKIQNKAIEEAKYIYRDLLTKFMMEQKSFKTNITPFVPKTNIKSFAELYGYKYSAKDNVITLSIRDEVVTINCGEGLMNQLGTINRGEESEEIAINIEDNNYYGDIVLLKKYVADNHELADFNYKKIINSDSNDDASLYIIIPILAVFIIGIIITLIALRKMN